MRGRNHRKRLEERGVQRLREGSRQQYSCQGEYHNPLGLGSMFGVSGWTPRGGHWRRAAKMLCQN